ncbi:uncharacterized protein LOC133731133 [Rosa rugosa]|uniref:uncharacterized protein LOC133731133 n=1 Tax=Rosa rugosa TaxID=74645 RepID=UPI002B408CBC|nr:uncharacterized protein LOC133731133 [Rosa rugosa]
MAASSYPKTPNLVLTHHISYPSASNPPTTLSGPHLMITIFTAHGLYGNVDVTIKTPDKFALNAGVEPIAQLTSDFKLWRRYDVGFADDYKGRRLGECGDDEFEGDDEPIDCERGSVVEVKSKVGGGGQIVNGSDPIDCGLGSVVNVKSEVSENLRSSIEEELGKVSLVGGNEESLVLDSGNEVSEDLETKIEGVEGVKSKMESGIESESSESESESESESSSAASSSLSSSSSDEEEEDERESDDMDEEKDGEGNVKAEAEKGM